jgi:hypothetical protein
MPLFRKKEKKLFGDNITPDCSYCANNAGGIDQVFCSLEKEMKNGKCRKYCYNPLLRKPANAVISLKKDNFSQEDFSL